MIRRFGQEAIVRREGREETLRLVDVGVVGDGRTDGDTKAVFEEGLGDGDIHVVGLSYGMLGLSAADVDIDELTDLGVRHGCIDTAVDDGGEGVSFALCGYVRLTYVHTRSQECGGETFARLLIHGRQLAGDRLILRRLEEETDRL